MPRRLFRYYQRKRIVNINVNVIAAGLLALLPTTALVWAAKLWIPESGGLSLPGWLWTDTGAAPASGAQWVWIPSSAVFTGLSIASDIFFDVAIYYMLHWVANHWRPLTGHTEVETHELSAKPPPFMRDASLIQFERALLSPIYYLTAGGLMQYLQDGHGVRAGFAVLVAFPSGLIVTRLLHTLWGLRSGTFLSNADREAKRAAKAKRRATAAAGEGGAGQGGAGGDGQQAA